MPVNSASVPNGMITSRPIRSCVSWTVAMASGWAFVIQGRMTG